VESEAQESVRERAPHLQTPSKSSAKVKSRTPVVKTEPVEADDALRSPPPSSSPMAKKKQSMRFSSPIVISSEDSDPSTPKGRSAKGNNMSK